MGTWSYQGGHRPFVPPEWDVVATLTGHREAVTAVGYHPDGNLIISGSSDSQVKMWARQEEGGAQKWLEVASLTDQPDVITAVAFDTKAKFFLTASGDGTLNIWRFEPGNPKKCTVCDRVSNHASAITAAAWSPDQARPRFITGSTDRSARIYGISANDGKATLKETVQGHTDGITCVDFDPHGKHFVTGSHDNTLKVWEITGGQEKFTLFGHNDKVTSVAWSPDGNVIVSSSSDRTARVWTQERGDWDDWRATRLGLGSVTRAEYPGKEKIFTRKDANERNSAIAWSPPKDKDKEWGDKEQF